MKIITLTIVALLLTQGVCMADFKKGDWAEYAIMSKIIEIKGDKAVIDTPGGPVEIPVASLHPVNSLKEVESQIPQTRCDTQGFKHAWEEYEDGVTYLPGPVGKFRCLNCGLVRHDYERIVSEYSLPQQQSLLDLTKED